MPESTIVAVCYDAALSNWFAINYDDVRYAIDERMVRRLRRKGALMMSNQDALRLSWQLTRACVTQEAA